MFIDNLLFMNDHSSGVTFLRQ